MNIASERVRLGLEQKDLAKKLKTSSATVSRWERGITKPDADQLVSMHKLFGCSVDYLLGVTDERMPRNAEVL